MNTIEKSEFYQARLQALQQKAHDAKQRAKRLAEKSDLMCEKLKEVVAEVHKKEDAPTLV